MDEGGSGNLAICPMLIVLCAMADALVSTDARRVERAGSFMA